MKSLTKLQKIKGDASFREFYRNRENKSIIVVSKKEKLKNLLIYDAINKILIKNKIFAPNLLSENYINNYIEINDFGDQTLFQILKNKKNNKYVIFKKIIKILNKLQLIKDKKVKNFKNKLYKVQEYKNKILFDDSLPKKQSKNNEKCFDFKRKIRKRRRKKKQKWKTIQKKTKKTENRKRKLFDILYSGKKHAKTSNLFSHCFDCLSKKCLGEIDVF